MAFNNDKNPRKPWFTWAFWILSFIVINFILSLLQLHYHIVSSDDQLVLQDICEIGIIIAVLLINHFYTKEKFFFNHWNIFSHSLVIDIFFIFTFLELFTYFPYMHHVLMYGCLTILVGVAEEMTFRGLILGSFLHNWKGKNPILAAILLSSLVFAITHSLNVFSQPLKNTLIQIIVAFSLGIILAIMYLKTGNLITPILFHTLTDFISMSVSNTTESQTRITPALVTLLIALIVLAIEIRAKSRQQIATKFNVK